MKYNSSRKFVVLLVFVALLSFNVNAQDKATENLRVLFVGNSYTYFWNLPQTVETLASSKEKTIVCRKSTAGGMSLKQHWDGERELKSRELIKNGDWDYVVLQNHSMSAIENSEEFMEYGKKFIDLIQESGAKPILYMTWARKFNPLMQEAITNAYTQLGEETGTKVAPVGEAWKRVRELRPDLELFAKDESHPSPEGTYLAACVFFKTLTGEEVKGLSGRVKIIDKNGEELFLSIISNEDAGFLQAVADEVVGVFEFIEK